MRVSFYTLGCKVNQNETGALAQLFESSGYTVAAAGEEATFILSTVVPSQISAIKKAGNGFAAKKGNTPAPITVLTVVTHRPYPRKRQKLRKPTL